MTERESIGFNRVFVAITMRSSSVSDAMGTSGQENGVIRSGFPTIADVFLAIGLHQFLNWIVEEIFEVEDAW